MPDSRHDLPLTAACPPALSTMGDALRAIEQSGTFSNGGPVVRRFEREIVETMLGGEGAALAVGNATLGLMLAVRQAREGRPGKYALMPSFTFAAAAHAAIWAGLTPLLCDSDPGDWAASAEAEEDALRRHGEDIAVIVPYDTFGAGIDLDRYERIAREHPVGIVVDAAASLGTIDRAGRGFGSGASFAIVYSMHATKPFATGEGGLIYSADARLIETLRRMHNFGFGDARSAILPGFNAKLPEVLGLMALAKLGEFEGIAEHRATLAAAYRERLAGDFTFQRSSAKRQVAQFMPVLLPPALAPARNAIQAALGEQGIGSAHYFSPHLAQQPWFQQHCVVEATPVADAIGARILSLPVTDRMTADDVHVVCDALRAACASRSSGAPAVHSAPEIHGTLLVGGGPAGMAMLIAASKQDKLTALAQSGLIVVERGHSLGGGQLGNYAITSDSTAETFLSAVKDNVHPTIAALMDHPGGREIARYVDALGVPLARTRPYLEAIGDRIGAIVEAAGGSVLTGHEVVEARRTGAGLWQSRVRDLASGAEREILSSNIVLATGGYQSPSGVAAEQVAGMPLGERACARLMLSDEMLRIGGIARLRERLGANPAPRIAIVGASTSALAGAALLLRSGLPLGADAVTLLYRGALRPFYPSIEAAHADGFTDFGPDDICPVSGFVYRLAGFRLEARELVLRMLAIGGRVPDPRVRLHHIHGPDDHVAAALLDRADIVVGALGYRPHALPLYGVDGERIALAAHAPGRPRLVDQQCRVIDADGQPLPNAFGIGLAAGFVPEGRLGGEPSFRGKANGLWLWQNDVGQLIIDQLIDGRARIAA